MQFWSVQSVIAVLSVHILKEFWLDLERILASDNWILTKLMYIIYTLPFFKYFHKNERDSFE